MIYKKEFNAVIKCDEPNESLEDWDGNVMVNPQRDGAFETLPPFNCG